MIYIGIDFGATNLKAVSVSNSGTVLSLKLNKSQGDGNFTPNVILYDKIKDRVEIKVGKAPKNSLDVDNKVSHIKPKLAKKSWSKFIVNLDREVSAPEVVKDIFAKLWREIKIKFSKNDSFNVAVTVPVSFSEVQKNLLRQAALDAGVPVSAVLTESFAAIFSDENFDGDEQTILIFDFGGSTLDLSLCRIEGNEDNLTVTELAAAGLKFGGIDIDNAIYEKIFAAKYADELKTCLRDDNGSVLVELKNLIENLKEEIFRDDEEDAGNTVSDMRGNLHEFELTRDEIKSVLVALDVRGKIFNLLDELFDDAEIDKSEVTKIRMFGGTSTIDYVHEILAEYFGENLFDEDDFDADEIYMSVAAGAAKYLCFLDNAENVSLKNVVPFSIGLADETLFKRQIKRNELAGFVTPFKPLRITDLEKNSWKVAVYQSFANDFVLPLDDEAVIFVGDVALDKNLYNATDAVLYKLQARNDGQIAMSFFELQPDEEAPVLVEEKFVSLGG